MKRIGLEVPHAHFWKLILDPNSEKVEALEALRLMKCDLKY